MEVILLRYMIPSGMKCESCPVKGEGKDCALYCRSHEIPVCAKCGANHHKSCAELWDCRDLSAECLKRLKDLAIKAEIDTGQPDICSFDPVAESNNLSRYARSIDEKLERDIEKLNECIKYLQDQVAKLKKRKLAANDRLHKQINNQKMNIAQSSIRLEMKTMVLKDKIQALAEKAKNDDFKEVYEEFMRLKKDSNEINAGMLNEDQEHLKRECEAFIQDRQFDNVLLRLEDVFTIRKAATVPEQTENPCVHYINPLRHELYFFDLSAKKGFARKLFLDNGTPFNAPSGSDSVILGGVLYITGGTRDEITCLKETYEYSFLFENVYRKADMLFARKNHALVGAQRHIYNIAGRTADGLTAECERLCVYQESGTKENDSIVRWERLSPLPVARSGAAVAVFNDRYNAGIYVYGGLSSTGFVTTLDFLLCSNPGHWETREIRSAGEYKGRYGSALIAYPDTGSLILFGGEGEIDYQDCYEIDKEHCILRSMPNSLPYKQGGSFAGKPIYYPVSKKFFIIGAYDILIYDIETLEWHYLPETMWHPM